LALKQISEICNHWHHMNTTRDEQIKEVLLRYVL
jgi:hypothetical protein